MKSLKETSFDKLRTDGPFTVPKDYAVFSQTIGISFERTGFSV
jgi:hypothetical protein